MPLHVVVVGVEKEPDISEAALRNAVGSGRVDYSNLFSYILHENASVKVRHVVINDPNCDSPDVLYNVQIKRYTTDDDAESKAIIHMLGDALLQSMVKAGATVNSEDFSQTEKLEPCNYIIPIKGAAKAFAYMAVMARRENFRVVG